MVFCSLRGKTEYNKLYYDYVTINKSTADPLVVEDIKTSL